jgi:hypothetical protein
VAHSIIAIQYICCNNCNGTYKHSILFIYFCQNRRGFHGIPERTPCYTPVVVLLVDMERQRWRWHVVWCRVPSGDWGVIVEFKISLWPASWPDLE